MDEGFDFVAVFLAMLIVLITMTTFHPDLLASMIRALGLG